jgi:hypothetical protein
MSKTSKYLVASFKTDSEGVTRVLYHVSVFVAAGIPMREVSGLKERAARLTHREAKRIAQEAGSRYWTIVKADD